MRIDDTITGAVLLGLARAVLWHVSGFPPAPGQPYGSALFPALAASGLAGASALLVLQGWRARQSRSTEVRTERSEATGVDPDGAPLVVQEPSAGWFGVAAVIGAIVFYILAADRLGFVLCGVVLVAALLSLFRVRPLWVLPIALGATLVIHAGFYKLLRVPLPWGVLQPIAWW